MQRYWVPYRSAKQYREHGLDLLAHAHQTSTNDELWGIAHR